VNTKALATRVPEARRRHIEHGIHLTGQRRISPRRVDDEIRAERTRMRLLGGAARGDNTCALPFRELHSETADAARSAEDEERPPRSKLECAVAEHCLPSRERSARNRRRLRVVDAWRFANDVRGWHRDEFRVAPAAGEVALAEDRIAHSECRYVRADRLDDTRCAASCRGFLSRKFGLADLHSRFAIRPVCTP
jgi:hypothetical protein